MSERYLQSLAILLAGLFSTERTRSKELSPGQSPSQAEDGPGNAVTERGAQRDGKNQH